MRLIKQENFGECGLACLAMVLGQSLDEVRSNARAAGRTVEKYGLDSADMIHYLKHFGLTEAREVLERDEQPAILTVPSLNHLGFLHFVVWDGERYLDPSSGPLTYPDNGPEHPDGESGPQAFWASAIIWGPQDDEGQVSAKAMRDIARESEHLTQGQRDTLNREADNLDAIQPASGALQSLRTIAEMLRDQWASHGTVGDHTTQEGNWTFAKAEQMLDIIAEAEAREAASERKAANVFNALADSVEQLSDDEVLAEFDDEGTFRDGYRMGRVALSALLAAWCDERENARDDKHVRHAEQYPFADCADEARRLAGEPLPVVVRATWYSHCSAAGEWTPERLTDGIRSNADTVPPKGILVLPEVSDAD